MEDVPVREFRNDGEPVAPISPLPAPRLNTLALLEQWRTVPPLDGDILRADITTWLDCDL